MVRPASSAERVLGPGESIAQAPVVRLPVELAGRTALALCTASLLTLALPLPGLDVLAWVALAPLLLAIRGASAAAAAVVGWIGGVAAAAGVYRWIFEIEGFGWPHAALLGAYLGLYPALWCAGVVRLSRSRWPLLLSAPALWVVLEFARGHAGFLALPWPTLAHSQHGNLALIQLASVTGEAGVGFVVAMGSVVALALLQGRAGRPTALAGLGAIAAVHALGALAVAKPADGPALRVALVQPAIPRHDAVTPQQLRARYQRLEQLTREAARTRPALIAWPETAVRGLEADRVLAARLEALAAEVDASLLIGSSEAEKFRPRGAAAVHRTHNAAYHIPPRQPAEPPYHKLRLVPFGEYVPLQSWVAWPAWLVPRAFDVMPGRERRTFRLPDGTRFAVLICWENGFAELARRSVRDGARLLVHITNDNWFGRSAEPRQHVLASVLRAVENRVPVVLASNGGPSELIDSRGRVRAELSDLYSEGTLAAELSLASGPSLYTRFGDWFVLAAAVSLAAARALERKDGCASVPPIA